MSAPAHNPEDSIVTHARVVAHLSQNFGGGNSENHWDYPMAGASTFKNIRDLVLSYGRDRYRFSGGGSGCGYWWRAQNALNFATVV